MSGNGIHPIVKYSAAAPITESSRTFSWDSTLIDATTWSDGTNASNVWTFDVSGQSTTMTAGDGLVTFSHAIQAVSLTIDGNQDYILSTRGGGQATLIAQTEDTLSALGLFPKTGDGGNEVAYELFAQGVPGSFDNFEALRIYYNAVDKYIIASSSAGTGDNHPISIYVGGNVDQLLLGTDDTVTINADLIVSDDTQLGASNVDTTTINGEYDLPQAVGTTDYLVYQTGTDTKWGYVDSGTLQVARADTVVVVAGTNATSSIAMFDTTDGDLAAKTHAGLTFDASGAGDLTVGGGGTFGNNVLVSIGGKASIIISKTSGANPNALGLSTGINANAFMFPIDSGANKTFSIQGRELAEILAGNPLASMDFFRIDIAGHTSFANAIVPSANYRVLIQTEATGVGPLKLKGIASQTANMLDITDENDNLLANIDKDGKGSFASAVIGDDTNETQFSATGGISQAGSATANLQGLELKGRTVTANTDLTATDVALLCNHATVAFTVDLPSPVAEKIYWIKNINAATVTVDANVDGGTVIDNNNTFDLVQYEAIGIYSDGTKYWIF